MDFMIAFYKQWGLLHELWEYETPAHGRSIMHKRNEHEIELI